MHPTHHSSPQTAYRTLLAVALAVGAPLAMAGAPKGFTELFNGKDLTGWHGDNPHDTVKAAEGEREAAIAAQQPEFTAHWTAQDGELVNDGHGKKEGVVTLASGLQYQVLTEGTGKTPTAADEVECHYHGMLIDGTVFDSSVERGEPATFGVMQVIGGWVEALQLMKEGSKWRLFIPAHLAYGEQGAGNSIAPNSTLIFDVELLKII